MHISPFLSAASKKQKTIKKTFLELVHYTPNKRAITSIDKKVRKYFEYGGKDRENLDRPLSESGEKLMNVMFIFLSIWEKLLLYEYVTALYRI